MSTLQTAKQEIIERLRKELPDLDIGPTDLAMPPDPAFGDLAFGCFAAAKSQRTSPAQVAQDLAARFAATTFVASATAAGPYVNFFLDRPAFASAAGREASTLDFGRGEATERRVMIEYAQPNTHKEFHVGHLRNACLGLSVVKLSRAVGNEVVPVTYIGDVGAHVAKWLWYAVQHPELLDAADASTFGRIYVEATRAAEADPGSKDAISEVHRQLEAREPKLTALWEKTRQANIDAFKSVFAELGCSFDHWYFESDVEVAGKKLAKDLLESGVAKVGEGGALIVDLEDEKLGVFLVLKSDGSALYSTKELALAELKFSQYDIDESIHVVDSRQSLYFKQFFATLKRMGFKKTLVHLAYEFVTLKEGAMSSRKGNIVSYEEFRDEMLGRTKGETAKRHQDWDTKKVDEVAWAVAEGAMKFGMLKQDPDKPIVFDIEQSLSFDGFTGPYVQYAHARMSSILAKAGGDAPTDAEWSDDPAEFAALRKIADYPEVVRASAQAYKPSHLAQYLFELAQAASAFYRDVPVLTASDAERPRRLAIVAAFKNTLSLGLGLLGIRAPEEM
jgi:arginyl-tRNA synthetase